MSTLLQNLFSGVNLWFSIIIIGLFLWEIVTHYRKESGDSHDLKGAMTGVGILGTFLGVVLGLQDFDTADISSSIGPLLEGLKISFSTSVAGLFFNIFAEIIEKLFPAKNGNTGDVVADSLKSSLGDLASLLESNRITNQSVADTISAMRTEIRDESQKIRTTLEATLDKLSRGATEEIVQALEAVIREFNSNLTEQFGDNFKQLNEACMKLVDWQHEYAGQVAQTMNALNLSSKAVTSCQSQFEANLPKTQQFGTIVGEIGTSLETLEALTRQSQTTTEQHRTSLDEMSSVMKNVKEQFSSAETEVLNVTDRFATLSSNANEAVNNISGMLEEHAKGHQKVSESIADTTTRMGESNDALQRNLKKSLDELESALSSLTEGFGSAYRDYLDGLQRFTSK